MDDVSVDSGFAIVREQLPKHYPTHLHPPSFWEELGRTIATFGFLEETLFRAIFSYSMTTEYQEHQVEEAYSKWISTFEKSASDPLGRLIDTFKKAVNNNPTAIINNLEELICDLKSASKIRNVLCHGSWKEPDSHGASIPFFYDRAGEKFSTAIDTEYLQSVRANALNLICTVVETVTVMGFQFPGSNGPGVPIWSNE